MKWLLKLLVLAVIVSDICPRVSFEPRRQVLYRDAYREMYESYTALVLTARSPREFCFEADVHAVILLSLMGLFAGILCWAALHTDWNSAGDE